MKYGAWGKAGATGDCREDELIRAAIRQDPRPASQFVSPMRMKKLKVVFAVYLTRRLTGFIYLLMFFFLLFKAAYGRFEDYQTGSVVFLVKDNVLF